jgi:hypothetical protein
MAGAGNSPLYTLHSLVPPTTWYARSVSPILQVRKQFQIHIAQDPTATEEWNQDSDSKTYVTTVQIGLFYGFSLQILFFLFLSVLGFKLRAFTLSSPPALFVWSVCVCVKGFSRYGLANYVPRLVSNCDPPDLSLLSS